MRTGDRFNRAAQAALYNIPHNALYNRTQRYTAIHREAGLCNLCIPPSGVPLAQAVISRFGSGRKGAEEDGEAALARLR